MPARLVYTLRGDAEIDSPATRIRRPGRDSHTRSATRARWGIATLAAVAGLGLTAVLASWVDPLVNWLVFHPSRKIDVYPSHRLPNAARLSALGAHVLLLDYRGYGLSEGHPSERGVYADARAALHYLMVERGVDPDRIVLFGRSLGAAVAVEVGGPAYFRRIGEFLDRVASP